MSRGPVLKRLRKLCPASGYSLTSCATPAELSARSRRSRAAAQGAVAGAVAGDDRARAGEPLGGVLRDLAVVDRRGREAAAGRAQQREAAAHAEADDADAPGAVLARDEQRRAPPRCPRTRARCPSATRAASPPRSGCRGPSRGRGRTRGSRRPQAGRPARGCRRRGRARPGSRPPRVRALADRGARGSRRALLRMRRSAGRALRINLRQQTA